MPNRILREGINSSARVNRLSFGAEVLYRRLISVADDYGRYYANLTTVRGGCWPTHPSPPCEQDVSNWIAECQQGDRPLLTVYTVDGCSYLQITDFNQKVRSKSKFPEPASGLSAECPQIADKTPALDVCEVVLRSADAESKAEGTAQRKNIPAKSATSDKKPEWEDLNAGWSWYKSEYPGEVNEFTELRLYLSVIETREDLAELRGNLPLWKSTQKWLDGFHPSSENFLSKRIFKMVPKAREFSTVKQVQTPTSIALTKALALEEERNGLAAKSN